MYILSDQINSCIVNIPYYFHMMHSIIYKYINISSKNEIYYNHSLFWNVSICLLLHIHKDRNNIDRHTHITTDLFFFLHFFILCFVNHFRIMIYFIPLILSVIKPRVFMLYLWQRTIKRDTSQSKHKKHFFRWSGKVATCMH